MSSFSTTALSAPARARCSSATRRGSSSSSASPSTSSSGGWTGSWPRPGPHWAPYLGAAPDDLTFVQNATTGVNMAARSLDLRPGDEVLATGLEYGACDLAWEAICARAGARYVRAEMPLPAGDVVEQLFARQTDRTRVVYTSHITSETGVLLPVEEIVRRARDAGLTTIVDGAHAPGHVPLDLEALGADFYSGNCHKW